jgi:hypothetical protein
MRPSLDPDKGQEHGRTIPLAEMTVGSRGGRSLGITRRRGDAASRRWLRQPDACRRLLDHLIDAPIERRPHFEAERLGGLEG